MILHTAVKYFTIIHSLLVHISKMGPIGLSNVFLQEN